MKKDFSAAIFDLDGTLLDSIDDLTDALNAMLRESGFPTHGREQVKKFVGDGVSLLVSRALPQGQAQHTKGAVRRFLEIYKNNMQNKTRPYDGMVEVLHELKGAGIKLGVASNKPHNAVTELVPAIFSDIFDAAVGEGDSVLPKPNPDMIFNVLDVLSTPAGQALYIGDSEVDMQTAKAAGVTGVGCTWGFRDAGALKDAGADYLIDSPKELLKFFKA